MDLYFPNEKEVCILIRYIFPGDYAVYSITQSLILYDALRFDSQMHLKTRTLKDFLLGVVYGRSIPGFGKCGDGYSL